MYGHTFFAKQGHPIGTFLSFPLSLPISASLRIIIFRHRPAHCHLLSFLVASSYVMSSYHLSCLVFSDPLDPLYLEEAVAHKRISLVKHKQKKKQKLLRKLLDSSTITSTSDILTATATGATTTTSSTTGATTTAATATSTASEEKGDTPSQSGTEVQDPTQDPIVGYWKPTLDLSLVVDMQTFQRNKVPKQIAKVR